MGLSALNRMDFLNERNINSLATFGLMLSFHAIILMRSKGYWQFMYFMEKRWSRYRDTAVPVIFQYLLQQAIEEKELAAQQEKE